jgi:hypothetical protein
MDRFLPSGCNLVYLSHHVLQTACALVQTTCSSGSVFLSLLGGIVLKEALATSGLDPDCLQIVATSVEFQVFGGIF